VGYSFAIEDSNHKYYIPLRHEGGDNIPDAQEGLNYLREQAKIFKGEIVGAGLSYDLDFLQEEGITFPHIKFYRDVQIAEPLIDDLAMSYSLETISKKYLNYGKDEQLLREAAQIYHVDPKKELYKLPARFVGAYGEADADNPLKVLRRQEREIESQDLWDIFNIESKLLPILIKMRRLGVRVDVAKLEAIERWSAAEERKALEIVKNLSGVNVPFNDVWKAEIIAKPLEAIGCKVPITPKTKKPSIKSEYLDTIKHPVAEAIRRARKVNKIRTTFAQSIRDHMVKGRIHCVFHQLRSSGDEDEDGEGVGARYGRCSSANPNMQQQPNRDPEIGPMWRGIYIPEEGKLWGSFDFSSQEPRQTVHYAVSTSLGNVAANESARQTAAKYNEDVNTDPHQALANIIQGREATKDERFQAKTIFLGLSYGMGGYKLCTQLGLPTMKAVRDNNGKSVAVDTEAGQAIIQQGARVFEAAGEEGQKLLDRFNASVPFVRALARVCTQAVNKRGYIRTQAGRKCRFPKDLVGNYDWTHKALNRLIQGSAADQTKITMIALDEANVPMQLQIHDEIAVSVHDKEEAKLIVDIMEKAYKLSVPNKIDCEIGLNWGDAK
jgi:DNA polymerase I-like protein with 3'-5' exonuclease and polymerase domains